MREFVAGITAVDGNHEACGDWTTAPVAERSGTAK